MDVPREPNESLLTNGDSTAGEPKVSESNPLFVYVKLPVDLDPEDRTELFADPIQDALEKEGLGTVTGGGSMLSPPDEEGERETEFCGIDVDLYDLERGFALLRRELLRLEAPQGTTLLYQLGGREWEEPLYRMES
jgi:hypothetical protein